MLIFELTPRGIAVDSSLKTADELRSTLKPLLQLEKKGASLILHPTFWNWSLN